MQLYVAGGLVRFTLARALSSAGPYSKFGENVRSAGVGAISSRYLPKHRRNSQGSSERTKPHISRVRVDTTHT